MADAVTDTSPLVYLYRIRRLEFLPQLFGDIWLPGSVASELVEGLRRGYEVPDPDTLDWLTRREPAHLPSQWLALDLGPGELAVMALGLENPDRVLLLDDALARRTSMAADLRVKGTLGVVLLEAKSKGLTDSVGREMQRLIDTGFSVSQNVRDRILKLAQE